jgi:hypothetical protein
MPKQLGALYTAGIPEKRHEFVLKANAPILGDCRDPSHDANIGRA